MAVGICVVGIYETVLAAYDPGFVCAVQERYVAETGDEEGPSGSISGV